MQIEIDEEAFEILKKRRTRDKAETPDVLLCRLIRHYDKMDQEVQAIKARIGVVQYEIAAGIRQEAREPDPNHAKIVVINPLFNDGYHSAWGADCPVCNQYIYEESDVTPLPVADRPTRCDMCEQKIQLIYPWEVGATYFPEQDKEEQ
jgi:hypothetical protein